VEAASESAGVVTGMEDSSGWQAEINVIVARNASRYKNIILFINSSPPDDISLTARLLLPSRRTDWLNIRGSWVSLLQLSH
jgi:hypothetical protein